MRGIFLSADKTIYRSIANKKEARSVARWEAGFFVGYYSRGGDAVYFSQCRKCRCIFKRMKRSYLTVAVVSLLIDVAMVFTGLLLAYLIRSGGSNDLYFWPLSRYLSLVFTALPVWIVLFFSQGLYSVRDLPRGWKATGKILIGLLSGWGVALIALYLWRSPEALVFPRLVIIYGIIITTALTIFGRLVITVVLGWLNRLGILCTRTVVVTQNSNVSFAISLANQKGRGRELVDIIKSPDVVRKMESLYKKEPFDEVIVTSESFSDSELLEILNWTEMHGKTFALIPSLLSVRASNVEIGTLAGTPIAFFKRTPLEGWRRIFKRLIDVVLCIFFLILVSPILLIAYLAIKITSPGPALFKQPRVGQDGRTFYIHKFRSMYLDGDKRYPQFKGWSGDESTDPRITPVGRFLRRSNIDELPQLWDILRGDMSLVGPRPEQPAHVEKFTKEMGNYSKRHYVKSGLTGWAQINGLRGDTSIKERVKYDLYYIENWSILFDLRIILATIIQTVREMLR